MKILASEPELWRPIPGFPGYEASSHGRIRSSWNRVAGGIRGQRAILGPKRIMKPQANKTGHLFLHIGAGVLRSRKAVHRLVKLAFSQPEEGKPWVLHRDGDPQNNCIGNLKWGTPSENSKDAVRHGTHQPHRGSSQLGSKLSEEAVKAIKSRYGTETQKQLAAAFGVSKRTVQNVLSGAKWGWVE